MVLGLSFLSQFASTFNINTRSITFVPSKYSEDGVSLGKDPNFEEKPGISKETMIIILCVVGVIILAGMVCCCIEQYQRRKAMQEEQLDASILEIRSRRMNDSNNSTQFASNQDSMFSMGLKGVNAEQTPGNPYGNENE